MSIRYGQFCPVSKAAEVLGERWTILIIRELLLGTTRFRDFQRALSQISPSLLTKRLNQLQECGLVVRKTTPGQRRTEYQPMPAAKELKPIIFGLGKWGMRWARGRMNDDELDVELLMYDLIAGSMRPNSQVEERSIEFLPRSSKVWTLVDRPQNGTRELCVDNPGKEVDVHLTTDLRTMTRIWAGDLEIRAAKKSGQLQLTGNPILIRTLSDWLRPGLFANVRPHAEALNPARPGRTFHPAPLPTRTRKRSSTNRPFKQTVAGLHPSTAKGRIRIIVWLGAQRFFLEAPIHFYLGFGKNEFCRDAPAEQSLGSPRFPEAGWPGRTGQRYSDACQRCCCPQS